MDAFIETVSQILIDWGYPGLFISALLAGSIVPFSSEIVLLGLVKLGLDPTLCLISASLGNTAGDPASPSSSLTTEGAGRRACPHERLWDRFFVVLRINPRLSAIYKE